MRFNNFLAYSRIICSSGFLNAVRATRRNVLAAERGEAPPHGPYMAELDITYRCNCRCQMCQRWQDPRRGELSLEEYRSLADTLHRMGAHQVSVAGGEPLVRKDAFDIIRAFSNRGMSVNLCTNGLLLDRLHQEVCDSGPTCVTVSLDGATAESHDRIRGREGAFARTERGVMAILRHPRRKRPIIRVRMTVNALNQTEIGAFYRRWKHVADDVLLQPVHDCGDTYYQVSGDTAGRVDPEIITAQTRGTPWSRDAYVGRWVAALRNGEHFPWQTCYAGVMMGRIDPWGNLYPCLEQHVRIGSIRDTPFEKLWRSPVFETERERLATHRTCRCWYNNTGVIGHYGRLLKATGGIGNGRKS
ncbi:MAG: radical SAM protein [Desulfosarcinaceae bacterium]|nr:radical SAM protein [Desulfosarcinaceae bacterium]